MQSKRQAGMFTKIIVGVSVFLVVFWVAFGFTREGRRIARIDAARKHAETVSQLLAKDKRFEAVRVSEWYQGDGFFLVRGYVDTETDLSTLKSIVKSSKPPAPIAWQVQVIANTNGAVK
jgi:hypothetical protein